MLLGRFARLLVLTEAAKCVESALLRGQSWNAVASL